MIILISTTVTSIAKMSLYQTLDLLRQQHLCFIETDTRTVSLEQLPEEFINQPSPNVPSFLVVCCQTNHLKWNKNKNKYLQSLNKTPSSTLVI